MRKAKKMSRSEKSKSGFLDIFSKSTKRGASHQYNGKGARPVSANENDVMDAQERENNILRLTVEEVNKEYIKIIDDMNIPAAKREPLMKKNLEERRDMLRMHLKGNEWSVIHDDEDRLATNCLSLLKNPSLTHLLLCSIHSFASQLISKLMWNFSKKFINKNTQCV